MGSNNHERVAPLYTESTTFQTQDRYDPFLRMRVSGPEIPGTRKTTRRKRTVEQTWQSIRDEEGWESGHSYSGNFAVKPGYIVFGEAKVDAETLRAAGELVNGFCHEEYDWQPKPLERKTRMHCTGEGMGRWCDNGFVNETRKVIIEGQETTATIKRKCTVCKGKGTRPMTPDERKHETKRLRLANKALAAFGEQALRRAAAQYNEKWDDAAALVGKDHVWFGGYCSS